MLSQWPVVPGALILLLSIEILFFLNIIFKHPEFHNLRRLKAPGPLQFSYHSHHRHSDNVKGAKKSARHSPRSERLLEQAEGTALPVSYKTFQQTADYQWFGVPLVLQLRWHIGIFQFIDYLLHGWSRPRLSLQASPHQATKHTVRYKHDLFFTLTRIWKFPDAHFTKKNTKAVDINLKTIIVHDITY